jgi:hypothetical protein
MNHREESEVKEADAGHGGIGHHDFTPSATDWQVSAWNEEEICQLPGLDSALEMIVAARSAGSSLQSPEFDVDFVENWAG